MIKKFNFFAIYLLFFVPLLKPISTKLGVTILTSKVLLQTNKVNANNADFWWKKGNESFDKGNYFEAIFNFTELLKKDRNSSKAYFNRGLSRINIGDYYGGIIDYLKASKISPKESYIFVGLGNVYNYDLNNYKKGIEYYSTAIRLEPNTVNAFINRGIAYEKIGNFEKSILDYKKSIEINNSDPNLYGFLSNAQYNLGRNQEALTNINKAIDLKNDDPEFHYIKGLIYASLKNGKETCCAFQKSSDLGYADFIRKTHNRWKWQCERILNPDPWKKSF